MKTRIFLLASLGLLGVLSLSWPCATSVSTARAEQPAKHADPAPTPTPTPAPTPAKPVASIKGPLTANPGQFVLFDGTGASGGTIKWRVFPSTVSMVSDDGTLLAVEANPPFTLVQVVNNGTTFDAAVQRIELATPAPTPTPGPTPPPSPPPAPTPVASSLFLVTIDDGTTRTQATATVLGSADYWAGLVSKGHKFSQLDSANAAAAAFQPEITTAGGLPALVLMDNSTPGKTAKVLTAVKLPATTAAIDGLIKQYTGK